MRELGPANPRKTDAPDRDMCKIQDSKGPVLPYIPTHTHAELEAHKQNKDREARAPHPPVIARNNAAIMP